MSTEVEKFIYFTGEKEFEYVITEENGVYKGKATTEPNLDVTAESLTEAKELLRQKVAISNS